MTADTHLDDDLPQVSLGDIVRLKQPYEPVRGTDRQEGPFGYGIVAEILTVLPDGRVRNVSLYLYDPGRRELFMGPHDVPELCGHPHNSGNAESAVMRSRAQRLLQSLPLKGEHST